MNADNDWSHTWRSLPYSGTYTVQEVVVPTNYTASVTRSGSKFTITNTYIPVATSKVTVSKVWSGEAPHPASVEVALYKDGVEHASVRLNAENNWTYTWTNLERSAGWTVDEKSVPEGYDASISTVSAGTYRITNTKHVETMPMPMPSEGADSGGEVLPLGENIVVSGQKHWRHGANAQSAYPASVTIYIHADETIVKEVSVTGPSWIYSVVVPKQDANGNEIIYTVSEAPVPGYTAVVNSWDIINVHSTAGDGGPQTGDSNALWIWFLLMIISAIGMRVMCSDVSFGRKKGA